MVVLMALKLTVLVWWVIYIRGREELVLGATCAFEAKRSSVGRVGWVIDEALGYVAV